MLKILCQMLPNYDRFQCFLLWFRISASASSQSHTAPKQALRPSRSNPTDMLYPAQSYLSAIAPYCSKAFISMCVSKLIFDLIIVLLQQHHLTSRSIYPPSSVWKSFPTNPCPLAYFSSCVTHPGNLHCLTPSWINTHLQDHIYTPIRSPCIFALVF